MSGDPRPLSPEEVTRFLNWDKEALIGKVLLLEELVRALERQILLVRSEWGEDVKERDELQRQLDKRQEFLPPTYILCMSGHYYACTRGDEECPICATVQELQRKLTEARRAEHG